MSTVADALRVMRMEDDGLVATMVGRQVTRMGHTVAGYAADGALALSEALSLRPDLNMMDIQTPEIDGIELARLLCETDRAPVILVMPNQSPELIRRAAEAGVVAYRAKPPQRCEIERTKPIAMARFGETTELRPLARTRDEALLRTRRLAGRVPVCSYCKRIRDDASDWQQVERRVAEPPPAEFTHSLCPECMVGVLGEPRRAGGPV